MENSQNESDMQDKRYCEELAGIRAEISSLSRVVSRMIEQAGSQQLNMVCSDLRNDISRPLINYMIQDSKSILSSSMCTDCDRNEVCRTAFESLLQETALLLIDKSVDDEVLSQYEARFEKLREFAINENCDSCMSHAAEVFVKQMDLIRSLNGSGKNRNERGTPEISELSEDVVSCICEPLANKQRLMMLRTLSTGTKSFSELSRVTGLRGGNLLFHLQKLTDNNMVSQKSERGDYFLTRRGNTILQGLAELYNQLHD